MAVPYEIGCRKKGRLKQNAAGQAASQIVSRFIYSVDSISNPQASSSGSGMYLEFLLRRAHSRKRVERKY